MLRQIRDLVSDLMLRGAHRLASDDGWARMADGLGAPSMRSGLASLRSRGVTPRFAIDGGACVGHWCKVFRSVFPESKVLMVEPQREHGALLTQLAQASRGYVEFSSTLLGPPGLDAVDFTVIKDSAGGTGSSVLPERSDVPREVRRQTVCTLDSLVAKHSFGCPDLLKLDVQGYELEVLKGASAVLQTEPLVLLEVSLLEYNTGAPLLHEVVSWLAERQYRVVEVFDVSRQGATMVQMDLLFAPPKYLARLQARHAAG